MTKEQLKEKVYRCIDETYPGTTTEDLDSFNIDSFLDEAVRWVAKAAPVTALGKGVSHNSLVLATSDLRLLELKIKGWKTSVTEALPQNDPKYWQQQNPVLRGSNSRPVVFLIDGETRLEPYPSGEIETLRVFRMDGEEQYLGEAYENIPDKLLDITAWKTAELIFSMMQDANGVSVAQAQITSILPTL